PGLDPATRRSGTYRDGTCTRENSAAFTTHHRPKLMMTGEARQRSRSFGAVLCVLVVRFSSIGDILLTTPLVRALTRRHPEAKLVYVTKRAMAPRVSDTPHLAERVSLEPRAPIRHLARRLRGPGPT